MYGALHQIERIGKSDEMIKYDIVGPICELSDVYAKNYTMAKYQKSDYVVSYSYKFYSSQNKVL